MTRKTYEKKMKALMVAIYNHPESHFPEDYKIGEALKRWNAKTIDLPKVGGSYKAAWNSEPLIFCRRHYLGENI